MSRANGDGSVFFNTSKQLWCAAISFDRDGLNQRKYIYGKTQELVSDKLKLALADQVRGLQPTVDTHSVAAYLAEWLRDDVKVNLSPGTYALYECHVRKYIVPAIGGCKLTTIGKSDVAKLQASLRAAKLSPNSIRSVRGCLSAALNEAVRGSLIARNPVPLVKAPPMKDDDPDVLTPQQVADLLAAADKTPEYHALWTVLLYTGLRISEALGLTWRDVDLTARTLRVRRQLDRVRKDGPRTPGLVDLKTKGSKRLIPLTPEAVASLSTLHTLSRERRLACAVPWPIKDPADDYCFSNEIGGSWRANTALGVLKTHARRAGLPESVHLHTLRHSCATFLLARGVSDRVVMAILGHASLKMTQRYMHALPDMLADAASKLSGILPAAANS